MPSRFALPRFIINATFVLGIARIVKREDEAGRQACGGWKEKLLVLPTYFSPPSRLSLGTRRVPKLGVVYNDSPLQMNKEPLCKRVVIIERRSPHCRGCSISPGIKYQWVSLPVLLWGKRKLHCARDTISYA